MSSYFTGVTFAEQRVTPADDALVRRAILPDGVLSGCQLSYSGSTLTMAAGSLIACGRQFRHTSVQNWAVVSATSGFARLLLTIDLTRTSTTDSFDQVVDTIEYATSVDGFPELEQADINGAGTRYQIEICTISLGPGGITGIVSQIEESLVQPKGTQMTLLWRNPDPASDFPAKTIAVDLSACVGVFVRAKYQGANNSGPTLVLLDRHISSGNIWSIVYDSTKLYYVTRSVSVDFENNLVTLGAASLNGTSNDGKAIPLDIWGVQGVGRYNT